MKKQELKKIAKNALNAEYGFAPALKDIMLLEAASDGSYIYIMFAIHGNKYQFHSRRSDIYGVFVGKGTIERYEA